MRAGRLYVIGSDGSGLRWITPLRLNRVLHRRGHRTDDRSSLQPWASPDRETRRFAVQRAPLSVSELVGIAASDRDTHVRLNAARRALAEEPGVATELLELRPASVRALALADAAGSLYCRTSINFFSTGARCSAARPRLARSRVATTSARSTASRCHRERRFSGLGDRRACRRRATGRARRRRARSRGAASRGRRPRAARLG